MSQSTPIELPNTVPGGMSASVNFSPIPYVDDRVEIGPLVMPMREFCALVEHVLTCAPLKDGDPRERLLAHVDGHVLNIGPRGQRSVSLCPDEPDP